MSLIRAESGRPNLLQIKKGTADLARIGFSDHSCSLTRQDILEGDVASRLSTRVGFEAFVEVKSSLARQVNAFIHHKRTVATSSLVQVVVQYQGALVIGVAASESAATEETFRIVYILTSLCHDRWI